jgi:WD repeat-containing protein 68
MSANKEKERQIYSYDAPFPMLYASSWSVRPENPFRLAVGSFVEDYENKIQIISLDEDSGEFIEKSTFNHGYPATKIIWMPDPKGVFPDLLATSGDFLRVWRAYEKDTLIECVLNNSIKAKDGLSAPLTSFDWNEIDPGIIGSSSVDTTCTIWALETGQQIGQSSHVTTATCKTQLIAHDKEVFDIAFSRAGSGTEIFASVGAEGSVRQFDLRNLQYSTVIYENPEKTPLLRLGRSLHLS